MTTATDTRERVRQLAGAFETARRGDADDGEKYIRLRDGSPQWMTDAVHAAHGEMFPDDHRYAMVQEIVDAITADDDPDKPWQETVGEIEAPIYTSELTGWLHSRADRYGYCDSAAENLGLTQESILKWIAAGWQEELNETASLLMAYLESHDDA